MKNFQTSIRFQKTQLYLKFSEIDIPLQSKYFVEISSGDEKTSFIEMHRNQVQGWHIVPPAEEWTRALQDQLVEIISTQHKQ